jgi:uncharacterized membrane protein YciS (DUF1049 family)
MTTIFLVSFIIGAIVATTINECIEYREMRRQIRKMKTDIDKMVNDLRTITKNRN